jgi:hypothetical protein
MGLSAPSQAAVFLAVLLAILALLVRYADAAIPLVSDHSFETLLVGFLVLLGAASFAGFRYNQRSLRRCPFCYSVQTFRPWEPARRPRL